MGEHKGGMIVVVV